MSNDSFEEKKIILRNDYSKFSVLNKGIDELDSFAEKEIIDREKRLAKIVAEKYSLPDVNTEGIKFEENFEVICNGEVNPIFMGSTILSYKLKGKEYPVDSYVRLIISIAKQLYEIAPDKVRELAANHFNPWNEDPNSTDCIHYSYGDSDKDYTVVDNIKVHTGYNAKYCVQFCEAMIHECGIESDELSIYLKNDSIRGDSGVSKQLREKKIRQALHELSEEGIIEYSVEDMPFSHNYIKFLLPELSNALGYDGPALAWNEGTYDSAYYLEYYTINHELLVCMKNCNSTKLICQMLYDNADKLDIITENSNKTWWHIKKYPIDYKAIYDAEGDIEEFKRQIKYYCDDIRKMASQICILTINEV